MVRYLTLLVSRCYNKLSIESIGSIESPKVEANVNQIDLIILSMCRYLVAELYRPVVFTNISNSLTEA